jgi:adenosine deaminase
MAPYWPQKVLLHDHLDASFPLLSILPQLHYLSGKEYPFSGDDQYKQVKSWFMSSRNIVERFSVTTGVMQNRATLSLTAETYVKIRAEQGFRYCESTVAPQYHIPLEGLENFEEFLKCDPKKAKERIGNVVSALISGIKRGEKKYPQIEVNLLFTIGREVSAETAVFLVEAAANCNRDYVVGIGLVCDEAAHPPEKHIAMFRRAQELGFKTTCHAGEWVCGSGQQANFHRDLPGLIKNTRTAVFELRVDRIGHAIGLPYDSELMKIVIDRQIGIEGCPGSNFASGLIPDMKCLGIRKMLNAGVLYSIHPDDDLFLPDLSETFQLCDDECRFTEEEERKLMLNAWKTKFGKRKSHQFD